MTTTDVKRLLRWAPRTRTGAGLYAGLYGSIFVLLTWSRSPAIAATFGLASGGFAYWNARKSLASRWRGGVIACPGPRWLAPALAVALLIVLVGLFWT